MEKDEYPAFTADASGHLGYRNLISDFRTPLIFPAIHSFYENKRKAMNRNWSNQKANPALKTKNGK